jgi:hypothetical protein
LKQVWISPKYSKKGKELEPKTLRNYFDSIVRHLDELGYAAKHSLQLGIKHDPRFAFAFKTMKGRQRQAQVTEQKGRGQQADALTRVWNALYLVSVIFLHLLKTGTD